MNTASAGPFVDARAAEGRGLSYELGLDVPQDNAEAAKWYAEAMKRYREVADQCSADPQGAIKQLFGSIRQQRPLTFRSGKVHPHSVATLSSN